jgi:hypothetical protein
MLSGTQMTAAVLGKNGKSGALVAGSLLKIDDRYVAGATKVMIRGKIVALDKATGRVVIDSTVIDASAFVADGSIQMGMNVVVAGTQPVLEGLVLAESLIAL